jgi:hypothetical protein
VLLEVGVDEVLREAAAVAQDPSVSTAPGANVAGVDAGWDDRAANGCGLRFRLGDVNVRDVLLVGGAAA